MVLNVHRNLAAYWGRGEGEGNKGGRRYRGGRRGRASAFVTWQLWPLLCDSLTRSVHSSVLVSLQPSPKKLTGQRRFIVSTLCLCCKTGSENASRLATRLLRTKDRRHRDGEISHPSSARGGNGLQGGIRTWRRLSCRVAVRPVVYTLPAAVKYVTTTAPRICPLASSSSDT